MIKASDYTTKIIIDNNCTSVYHSSKWGKSNQSIFVAYCIISGSGIVIMDEPGVSYINKMREHDLKTLNEKLDMVESLCKAGDINPELIASHTNYYTIIDQYLAQSVKRIGDIETSFISMNIKNNIYVKEHWEFLSKFLKSILKMKTRYLNQINKIYKEIPQISIDYVFTNDPKKFIM